MIQQQSVPSVAPEITVFPPDYKEATNTPPESPLIPERSPLRDFKTPAAVITSDNPHLTVPSSPPEVYTARTLSSLPCPPSLLPHEWNLFTTDLQRAAALSLRQKTLAVVVAIATPVGCPIIKGVVAWAMWRHLSVKNIRLGLEDGAGFEQKRKRESVKTVVERWNERWRSRGVKVSLKIRAKGERKGSGEKGKLKVVVEDVRSEMARDESESEYDEDLEKDWEKV